MDNKLTTPICLSALFLAFCTVSVLVVVSRRNPFFVERKLRLGALLLSLTGVSAGCQSITCYDPAPVNDVSIDNYDYSTGILCVNQADTIAGTMSNLDDTLFSFMITDTSGKLYYKDNILPADGKFDENTEKFTITLPALIVPGFYRLELAPVPADSIENNDYYRQVYNLSVTEKPVP